MKAIKLTILFFLLFNVCFAQHVPFCGFSIKDGYSSLKNEYITHEANANDESGIPDVVSRIEKVLGFNVEIAVFIAEGENNCAASVVAGGRRILIADFGFLSEVNSESETKWAAISVIAHEVGHHIAGFNHHPSQLDNELDADYWSGFTLKKLGASRSAAIKCIMKFGTEQDTRSHPNKYSRARMIEKGWDDAARGIVDYSKCSDCK